jgi:hypothetical protein
MISRMLLSTKLRISKEVAEMPLNSATAVIVSICRTRMQIKGFRLSPEVGFELNLFVSTQAPLPSLGPSARAILADSEGNRKAGCCDERRLSVDEGDGCD